MDEELDPRITVLYEFEADSDDEAIEIAREWLNREALAT